MTKEPINIRNLIEVNDVFQEILPYVIVHDGERNCYWLNRQYRIMKDHIQMTKEQIEKLKYIEAMQGICASPDGVADWVNIERHREFASYWMY